MVLQCELDTERRRSLHTQRKVWVKVVEVCKVTALHIPVEDTTTTVLLV